MRQVKFRVYVYERAVSARVIKEGAEVWTLLCVFVYDVQLRAFFTVQAVA